MRCHSVKSKQSVPEYAQRHAHNYTHTDAHTHTHTHTHTHIYIYIYICHALSIKFNKIAMSHLHVAQEIEWIRTAKLRSPSLIDDWWSKNI